jgi:ABC-2 type transport system ATP-binding protein
VPGADQGLQGLLDAPARPRGRPGDLPHRAARDLRAAGPQRVGQEHDDQADPGPAPPHRGPHRVFGKDPTDVAIKRRIGYLPEESYLYGFLNARETLDYYGKLFELDRKTRKHRIDELLDMVGLTHAQYRPVREYSKGMQRRIGIAQALINDPEFLILDEPTTGLDPIGTRQVKDLIIEMGRRGKSVLLSSHLLADVEDVVDRMVILYGGKIRREGEREALLTKQETTSIIADELDDATIAEIDRIIRERSGGEKSLRSVTKPHQKLEELFLGIVEQAKSEQAATSGAMHGGETASFLKADAEETGPRGGELIASLMTAAAADATDDADRPAAVEGEAVPDEPSPADEVLSSLMSEDEPAPGAPATTRSGAQAPAERGEGDPDRADPGQVDLGEVDEGVIGSLLDADAESDGAGSDDDGDETR